MQSEAESKKELTEEQKEEIKNVLNLFNGEIYGTIESNKLKLAMKALGFEPSDEEVTSLLSELDKENKGTISCEDFTKLMSKKMLEMDPVAEMKTSFKLLCEEGTNKITYKSLEKAVNVLAKKMTSDEILQLIAEADKDKDGAIGEEDFIKVLKNTDVI